MTDAAARPPEDAQPGVILSFLPPWIRRRWVWRGLVMAMGCLVAIGIGECSQARLRSDLGVGSDGPSRVSARDILSGRDVAPAPAAAPEDAARRDEAIKQRYVKEMAYRRDEKMLYIFWGLFVIGLLLAGAGLWMKEPAELMADDEAPPSPPDAPPADPPAGPPPPPAGG